MCVLGCCVVFVEVYVCDWGCCGDECCGYVFGVDFWGVDDDLVHVLFFELV